MTAPSMVAKLESALADDAGTVAPLAIGLASILLATTFTFVNVGSLLLFEQRETQQAEALALAVDEATDTESLAAAVSDNSILIRQARSFAAEAGMSDFAVSTFDGKTVTAKVCGVFDTPIKIPLLGGAVLRAVCATAKARRI